MRAGRAGGGLHPRAHHPPPRAWRQRASPIRWGPGPGRPGTAPGGHFSSRADRRLADPPSVRRGSVGRVVARASAFRPDTASGSPAAAQATIEVFKEVGVCVDTASAPLSLRCCAPPRWFRASRAAARGWATPRAPRRPAGSSSTWRELPPTSATSTGSCWPRRSGMRRPSSSCCSGTTPTRTGTFSAPPRARWCGPRSAAEYREELQGISEGLAAHGVKLDTLDLTVMNAWMELSPYWFKWRQAQQGKTALLAPPEHCSAFRRHRLLHPRRPAGDRPQPLERLRGRRALERHLRHPPQGRQPHSHGRLSRPHPQRRRFRHQLRRHR